jgi:SAM-dependent methyltransferase
MSRQPLVNRLGLNCLVFVTGATVMILEVLGTRIIGPYYGVTLYVWTALIFVTLISLAGGYYCGGALADQHPGVKLTSGVTIGAATFILLIPIFAPVVLPLTNSWGVRLGTLVSAAMLFGPPLFLLAMVMPCAVKARTEHLGHIGSSVGSLYGISTVGSCLGTLLAAYVLIPSMRTYSILYCVSMGLAVTAGSYLLIARRSRETAAAGIVLLIALTKLATAPSAVTQQEGDIRVLFRADSVYGKVQVVDDALSEVRWLMSDCSVVGAEYWQGKASLYPFLRMIEAARFLNPAGRRALAIGLGSGAVPKLLGAAGIQTDVVEIDPNVVRAARDFFEFEPNGEVYVEDGRQFLKRTGRKYDFIVHDTFTGGTVPFHLLSRQVFEDTRRVLADDGVLCLVFVGYFSGDKALSAHSVFKTLSKVYPHVLVVVDPDDDSRPSNLLFFASRCPLNWKPAAWTGLSEATRKSLETQRKSLRASEGIVIADELNPLDLWQVDKNESYREWILEQFPMELLID